MDTLGLLLAVVVHPANLQDRDGAKLVVAKANLRRSPMKRSVVTSIAVLLVLIAATILAMRYWPTGPPPHGRDDKVTIVQAGDFFLYAPIYVAQDAGFFRSNRLDVTIVSSGGDEKTWAAILSGDASFGVADPTFIALSTARGQPGKVVASIVNGVPFWGITINPKIEPITNPSGLKDYTVATFPAPSTAYTLQRKMFEDAKLPPRIREGAFGAILPMLEAGAVDIALEIEPNVSQAVKHNNAKVLYSLSDTYGAFAITGLTTTPRIIAERGELTQRVVCSIQQALDYIRKEPENTLELLRKRFPEIDASVSEAALNRVLKAGIIPDSVIITKFLFRTFEGE